MRGLSTPSGSTGSRSKSTCSFCKNPDHQVGKCPHVAVIKKSLDKGVIPLKYMASISPNDTSGQSSSWRQNSSYWRSPLATYYSQGHNWGELYKNTERAYEKWAKAQARSKAKKKGKTKRTCGFCGGKDHTRRTCPEITRLERDLRTANRKFREKFYEEFVEGKGLSTGAIVDIKCHINGGYNRPARVETVRTIVTAINWDSINLFAVKQNADTSWRVVHSATQGAGLNCGTEKLDNIQEFIRSGVYLKVTKSALEGKDIPCGGGYYSNNEDAYRAIPLETFCPVSYSENKRIRTWDTLSQSYNASNVESVTIVSPAPQVLADDWIDGYSDEMAIIFKKFTKAQLDFLGITSHIEEWAKK